MFKPSVNAFIGRKRTEEWEGMVDRGKALWVGIQRREPGKLSQALVLQHMSLPGHRALSPQGLLGITALYCNISFNTLWEVLVSMESKRHLFLCGAVYMYHGLEIWLISHLLILTEGAQWANPRAWIPGPFQFLKIGKEKRKTNKQQKPPTTLLS